MKIEKTLSSKIYIYSFVMTMAIVVFHAHWWCIDYICRGSSDTAFIRGIFTAYRSIGDVATGYFFALSGFLLYCNCDKKNVWQKVSKRFKTLLIPFLFWNLGYTMIYNLLYLIIHHQFKEISVPFLERVAIFFLKPPDGPLWYLIPVILFTCFSPIIVRLDKIKLYLLFSIAFVVAFYVHFFNVMVISDSYVKRMLLYLPTYMGGVVIAKDDKLNQKLSSLNNVIRILSLIMCVCTVLVYVFAETSLLSWLLLRIQPLLLWVITKNQIFNKAVSKNLKFTFLIYASHIFLIDYINLFIGRYELFTVFSVFLPIVIAVVIYVINFIAFHILDRILPKKAWLFITGGR